MRPSIALLFAAACSGDRPQIAIGPPPPKATSGTLAGPLCDGHGCKCKSPTDDPGVPDAGKKRFEVRLGPTPHELWLTVPGGVLYKSPERAETCFYIDLAPGDHPMQLHAEQPEGVSVAMTVRELGTKTLSWYDSFQFACGSPGVCTLGELDDKKAELAQAVKRNLHDPCGSTKVKGLIWDTGRTPDQLNATRLVVRFTLDIYKFEPTKVHGDSTCGAGDGSRRKPSPDEPVQ